MRSRTLALAESLLERFGIPQANESLMGDLVEECGSGRSASWLWHQTANAIVAKVARDIGSHKRLALRAIATGWIFQSVGWIMLAALVAPRPLNWVTLLAMIMVWPAFVGWAVGRTHRGQRAAMVLVYAASMLVSTVFQFSVYFVGIRRVPSPNLAFETGLNCIIVMSTLVGGFLQKPPMRLADQG